MNIFLLGILMGEKTQNLFGFYYRLDVNCFSFSTS
jgi:hypothetical protein